MSEDRGRLKNLPKLVIWLTGTLSRAGITVAIPRRNHTGFPIHFHPGEGLPEESRGLPDGAWGRFTAPREQA